MRENKWIEGNIRYSGSLCQYTDRIRPGCTKCVAACPSGALHPDRGCIRIDKDACTECGDCISVCPVGALSRKFGEIEDIRQDILRRAGSVIVVCDTALWHERILPGLRAPGKLREGVSPLLLENMGFLSGTEFALAAYSAGRAVIVPALKDTVSSRSFIREAELIGEITALLLSRRMVHVPRTIEEFGTALAQITEWEQLTFPPLSIAPSSMGKREILEAVIAAWLRAEPDHDAPSSFIPHDAFAEITCDRERCISCGACANHCRTRALQISSDGERLLHQPILCVNCGVCAEVCPEQALSAITGLRLSRDFLKVREIARFQMVRCQSCGRPFTTETKSRRVLNTLQASFGCDPVREKLLRLCPKCRPVQAFTTFAHWTKERR